MLYVSTRGGGRPQRFSEILLEGLAPDGGLYLPEQLPQPDIAALRKKSYVELAKGLLALFMDDVPQLDRLVEKSYAPAVFGGDEVTPLKALERDVEQATARIEKLPSVTGRIVRLRLEELL